MHIYDYIQHCSEFPCHHLKRLNRNLSDHFYDEHPDKNQRTTSRKESLEEESKRMSPVC